MYKHQSGFISLTWMSYFFSLAVIIMCAVKLVPVYVEHTYVKDALKFIAANNSDVAKLDKSQLKSKLDKYMAINTVGTVQSNSFSFERQSVGYLVNSVYEVRVPFFLNIDALLSFRSQLDTANPNLCCEYLKDVKKASK